MRKREWAVILCLGAILLLSIGVGRYELSLKEVIMTLFGKAGEGRIHTLIYNIRLPRALMVTLSGMALGLSGYVYQKVFRNPLVSPDILGASSGASLGAAIGIVFFGGATFSVGISAFIGSMVIVWLTIYLARFLRGQVLGLVLAGIVTTAISSALLMMLKVVADPYRDLPSIEFWLMGGFYNASWKGIIALLPACIIGVGLLFLMVYQLQILTLGEEAAKVLGMPIKKVRFLLIIGATLLVASVVAMNGLISWIGLIAPHIAKLFNQRIDKKKKWLDQVMVMIWGGLILLVADTICRTAFPTELPISVLTSLIGGIVLAFLLIYKSKYINN